MRLALRMNTSARQQAGLAGWLLAWLRTPLRERFARLATQLGRERAAPRMELVEALGLGGKLRLMLVVCDGQRYLVGAGADSVQSIVAMGRLEGTAIDAEAAPLGQATHGSGMRVVVKRAADDFGCGL